MSTTHQEIERRWLIARPDEAALAACPGAQSSVIVQTYLTAQAGETRRVRARTVGGRTVYTRTIKRRIAVAVAEEDEIVLTADAYTALLREADPRCRPIEKVRWQIPYGDFLLEIDLYPFWTRQAMLEIELPAPDTPLTLPTYLRVLREVTGEREYSNRALAQHIVAELP